MMMIKPDIKPRSTPQAELRALQQTLPAAAPNALQQAQTLGTLLGQSVARSAGNGAATAALLPLAAGRPDTWSELTAMQGAVGQRFQQLQQSWLQGWNGWLEEYAQLKRAKTMSEHMEQQFNLVAQFGTLLKNQASDVLNLQENIQVDYGYWVAQKVGAQPGQE